MNSSYQVLKNHMLNAEFLTSAALARIEVLADELKISETERDELIVLANEKGITPAYTTEGRIEALEAAMLDLAAIVAMLIPEEEETESEEENEPVEEEATGDESVEENIGGAE